ncbi:MCE family protein [Aeromicrobium sp. CF3.5]|uniref:MCE family protein n=1 Tax=Aeromicrobium sp. CF3.5 TaxID=3373078 RepID=UPI003EE66E14
MKATIAKSVVFLVVTVLATTVLASTIRNDSGSGEGATYRAMFADATSVNVGDDVRVSGVKVGSISDVSLADNRLARITFSVRKGVSLSRGTTAELRFRNLVGQRYISLEPPTQPGPDLPAGHEFTTDETRPALDLTALFNGFQPLLQLLSPKDVNNLNAQIIAVFQGEGATVESLLSSTASLTSTLADKDQVIGELITNLSSVLDTVNQRSDQLDTTLITLDALVTGLAEDREVIGDTLDGLGSLTVSVSELLEDGRAPLKDSINGLGELSGNLSDADDVLDEFFAKLPVKFDRIGRTASYGSWFNFYACSIEGRIPRPEGYRGAVGIQTNVERCR